jgi:hypothetical protein
MYRQLINLTNNAAIKLKVSALMQFAVPLGLQTCSRQKNVNAAWSVKMSGNYASCTVSEENAPPGVFGFGAIIASGRLNHTLPDVVYRGSS